MIFDIFIHSSVQGHSHADLYRLQAALTIFLCMAMMYPMKGLSCTGVMCPLATPLDRGVSGLHGTTVLGPPLGIRTGLFARLWSPAEPLAIGVRSDENEDWGNPKNSLLEMEPSWRERVDEWRNKLAHLLASVSSLMWGNLAQESQTHTGSRSRTAGPSGYLEESSKNKGRRHEAVALLKYYLRD